MSAYFLFQQTSPTGALNDFVFKLNDPKRIAEARNILNNPDTLKVHVQGKIIPTAAPYNPNWSFHLEPDSIGFFEMQIEVCDANVTYVQEHLDEIGGSTLPNFFWCPWSSRLNREITDKIDPEKEQIVPR